MKHCGWNRNSKTTQKVTEKLPVIPNHLQTRFQGYQCIGIFGDGYINDIPQSIKRNNMSPLATRCPASESLFASVSILIWGDIVKMQFLRLATVCYEILHCEERSDIKELIWLKMSSNSKNDSEDLREMHLKAIASITNRKITVYNASHGAKSYLCESVNVSPYLPLLELTLHGEDNMSYMPLVDGCLVGRGQRFFDRCGAMEFGLCHGDFGDKVTCYVCGQKYHVHCLEVYEEPLQCGCHLHMPFQLKDKSFYRNNDDMKEMIEKINLKDFVRSILNGRRPSLRQKIFCGKNSRLIQKQKEKQIHAVALTEEMIKFIINSTRKIVSCPLNHALDIYLPEVLIKIIQSRENVNRLLAELMMQEL
nr:uncharacterized protein LOC111111522 isoform X2 [Crassostrea virginica]